jgi:hypothetical protein
VVEGDLNQNLPIHGRPSDISADLKELEIARDPYTHEDIIAHGCLGPDPKATTEFLLSVRLVGGSWWKSCWPPLTLLTPRGTETGLP